MKKLFILFLLIPNFIFSQGWEKTYGSDYNDEGRSVQLTSDGGYIITGSFASDLYVLKTDELGNEIWSNSIGSDYDDFGTSIQPTNDNGYIIVGCRGSVGGWNYSIYLVKIDETGNVLWTRTFGGSSFDYGYSVHQTADNGYIIGATTYSYGNGVGDFYLIKTDSLGQMSWSKTYGGEDNENCMSMILTSDGGYLMVGSTNTFASESYDVYMIKTDDIGDTLWTRTVSGGSRDEGMSVQETQDNGYIVSGMTGGQGEDVFLIRTNGDGEILWTNNYGGVDNEYGNSVQETTEGDFIIVGSTRSFGQGAYDVYLIKTNSIGDTLWTRSFGGSEYDMGYSVKEAEDGGYITTGFTQSFGQGESDIYLIKTDTDGNITSTLEIPFSNPNRKLIKTIDLLGKEINPKENIPYIEVYDDGSTEKKLIVK